MSKLQKKMSSSKDIQYDMMAKIVIIGNSFVGKTNILLRFVDQEFSQSHTPTIGVDFRSKIIAVPNKTTKKTTKLKLQLWDTAGQQRFRNLTQTYFKGATGVIIVYSIDDRKSFQDVINWMIQLQQSGDKNVSRLIVANKCDLQNQRKVSAQQGRMLADQHKCNFMQVSAKQNINIDTMFNNLSMTIMSKLKDELAQQKIPNQIDQNRKKPVVLVQTQPQKKRQCCK